MKQRDEQRALRASLIIHGALLALLGLDAIFPFHKPTPIIPTLRVDLVGLPDRNPAPPQPADPPPAPAESEAAKPVPPPEPEKSEPEPKPDEMALKKAEKKVKTEKPKKAVEADLKHLKKKNQSALARIKALKKIHESISQSDSLPSAPIKGNKLSKGSSLSGDAKESDEVHYYEQIRDRFQQNWALPSWLSKADLSAQIKIFVDDSGNIRKTTFLKSSGNPQFDEAVRRCLHDSQPLPRPPSDLKLSVYMGGIVIGFPL